LEAVLDGEMCLSECGVLTQELISMISGRLPVEVEKSIRKLMATYATNLTSILSQFPSQQVLSSEALFI
jgi:hypothetical protein